MRMFARECARQHAVRTGDVDGGRNLSKPNMSSGNPRGAKKPEKPAPGRNFKLGSPFGYVLLLVLAFLLFRNVFEDAGVRKVSYSQFRDAVSENQFNRVQLTP